ncbi:MAG TPA: PDZ domain-containing protein [Longimicrobiales bacterium]|nr:PDZ domain-containing protein [Longimicrobiales bacterium]
MKVAALAVVAAASLAPAVAGAQQTPARGAAAPVTYDVAFPNAVHHEARITVTFRGLAPGRPLEALMARSSPGRYALHEFAKNVYDVSATDSRGRKLATTRPSPYEWDVAGHDGTVSIAYTVFGDHADGTYAGIDSTHAHFNMPAAFMFARGLENRPIRVTFHPRPGWKIATQLVPACNPPGMSECQENTFTAPHLQYFMDSPTELSAYDVHEWKAGPGGKYTMRLALHHLGTPQEAAAYTEWVQKVVREEEAVFGELAPYDYGNYTFLVDYLPWVFGDGMEHRNSTLITGTRSLRDAAARNIGTVAHEFFHSWNMERIRDRAIEPFAFERADMSGNLWFGEGFTQYYTPLIVRRAGIMSLDDYAGAVGGTVNAVVNLPGRRFRSAVEMSEYAPFADAAVSIDLVNQPNTFISYYTWGAAIGLALDLTLRERYKLTLDDYMRAMWQGYGRLQANGTPQRPYTRADLRRTLGQLTKDTAFADDFFRRYIEGREVVDYKPLLAPAGLLLRPANAGKAWLGPTYMLRFEEGAAVVAGPTLIGTPLYAAGIDNGDRIEAVDGRPVTDEAALLAMVQAHRPGDAVPIRYVERGETKTGELRLAEDPTLEVVSYEAAGMPVTDAIRGFRAGWLESRAR